MVLASIVNAPERMKTLPPLSGPAGVLALRVERPLTSTRPKLVTVKADVSRGSIGTWPVPLTAVTWIVPAGALRVPPVMATGPATSPRLAGADLAGVGPGASVLPLTVIAAGLCVKNPKAAGGMALKVLASGLVA
jgi:hypothetical protein